MTFPNSYALRSQLSWTHYRLLMRVEDTAARNFYLEECTKSNWSTRQLERQNWFVFVLWHRFSSDAGLGMTGTEKEWNLARQLDENGEATPGLASFLIKRGYQFMNWIIASLKF